MSRSSLLSLSLPVTDPDQAFWGCNQIEGRFWTSLKPPPMPLIWQWICLYPARPQNADENQPIANYKPRTFALYTTFRFTLNEMQG